MTLPHPESRQNKYRNRDKPDNRGVVRKFFKWAINITGYRNRKYDVDPADDRALGGGAYHMSSFLLLFCAKIILFHSEQRSVLVRMIRG